MPSSAVTSNQLSFGPPLSAALSVVVVVVQLYARQEYQSLHFIFSKRYKMAYREIFISIESMKPSLENELDTALGNKRLSSING